jgi:hypothetical protein
LPVGDASLRPALPAGAGERAAIERRAARRAGGFAVDGSSAEASARAGIAAARAALDVARAMGPRADAEARASESESTVRGHTARRPATSVGEGRNHRPHDERSERMMCESEFEHGGANKQGQGLGRIAEYARDSMR